MAAVVESTVVERIAEMAGCWLDEEGFAALPQRLAVGWSGGADSTALLLLLKASGREVQAWHVDHGWRDTSAAEAEQLRRQAEVWGIPFLSTCIKAEVNNREAAARAARLHCFQCWGEAENIDALCLGHHLDDQAETVCMRMLQGAGVAGCRGMHAERGHGGLKLFRPLLNHSRSALERLLCDCGVGWFDDPSNSDLTIWRNRIRHTLFPYIRKHEVDPVSLFMRWQRQADLLNRRVEAASSQSTLLSGESQVSLSWIEWQQSAAPVRARLLQRMMCELFGEGVTPGRRHILLAEAWTGKGGRGGLDLSGCRLQRQRGELQLLPATSACG